VEDSVATRLETGQCPQAPGAGRSGWPASRAGPHQDPALNARGVQSDAKGVKKRARDATWDAIVAAAERLNQDSAAHAMRVVPERQRSWTSWTVTDGFAIGDKWTDAFEPVRRRGLTGSTWTEIQPVERASATVARFLRERPDLV